MQRLHLHNLRVAREASHRLCPGLVKALHTPKLDDWVNKLAEGQITQYEFQTEICGDSPLHYREIVQAYLDNVGREPEPEMLTHLGEMVESGEKSLPDVIAEVKRSPEASEWAQVKWLVELTEALIHHDKPSVGLHEGGQNLKP